MRGARVAGSQRDILNAQIRSQQKPLRGREAEVPEVSGRLDAVRLFENARQVFPRLPGLGAQLFDVHSILVSFVDQLSEVCGGVGGPLLHVFQLKPATQKRGVHRFGLNLQAPEFPVGDTIDQPAQRPPCSPGAAQIKHRPEPLPQPAPQLQRGIPFEVDPPEYPFLGILPAKIIGALFWNQRDQNRTRWNPEFPAPKPEPSAPLQSLLDYHISLFSPLGIVPVIRGVFRPVLFHSCCRLRKGRFYDFSHAGNDITICIFLSRVFSRAPE